MSDRIKHGEAAEKLKLLTNRRGKSDPTSLATNARGMVHPVSGEVTHYVDSDGALRAVSPDALTPVLENMDRNNPNGALFTRGYIGSTLVNPWSGLVEGFNLLIDSTGTPSALDGSLSWPMLQREFEWPASTSLAQSTHALTGTFTTVGTALACSSAILNYSTQVGELKVGDPIKIGSQYRAIASIVQDGTGQNAVLNKAFSPDVTGQAGATGGYDLPGTFTAAAGSRTVTTSSDCTDYLCAGSVFWLNTSPSGQAHTVVSITSGEITTGEDQVYAASGVSGTTGGLRQNEMWWQSSDGVRVIFLWGTPQFPNDSGAAIKGQLVVSLPSGNSLTTKEVLLATGVSDTTTVVKAVVENTGTVAPRMGLNLRGLAGTNDVDWLICGNGLGTAASSSTINHLSFINQISGDYTLNLTSTGRVGIGTGSVAPTEVFQVSGNIKAVGQLLSATSTPASAAATGTAGTWAWDSSFIYICTATNTWKRVAIATW